MKVTLLPLDKQEVINKLYVACRTCYNAGTPNDMWKEITTEDALVTSDIIPFNLEKRIKLLKHVLDSQHLSVLEHCNITFLVSGVSRALTHQLVRHRHCSYSQQSQRYVEFKDGVFEYVTPNVQNVLFIIVLILASYPVYDWIVKGLDKLIYIKKE